MVEAKCPACMEVIQLVEETGDEELIVCPYCNTILEFVDQFPSILDWAEDPEVCSYHRIWNKLY